MIRFIFLLFLLPYFHQPSSPPLEEISIPQNNAVDSSKILIIGDTQRTSIWEFWREKNEDYRGIVLNKLAAENPAFIVHLGDIVFQGSSDSHWQEFDQKSEQIKTRNIPIYPLLGNHEYTGNNSKALKQYFDRFPITQEQMWYSYEYKNLAFIHLNANFSELNEQEIRDQNAWYETTLKKHDANKDIRFIIVACHQPPYTNSKVVSDDLGVQKHFVPLFQQNQKAKLFLSGHSHSYEHFLKSDKHFIVSGGGGGPRQTMQLSSPRHTDLYRGKALRPLHYCQLTIEQDQLGFSMHKFEDGQWIEADAFLIR